MPTVGPNVSVEGYSSGTEGSQITYYCQPGLLPSEMIVANCTSNGQWNPNPSSLECYVTDTTPTKQIHSTSTSGLIDFVVITNLTMLAPNQVQVSAVITVITSSFLWSPQLLPLFWVDCVL